MKITIDGVEYIAEKKSKSDVKDGIRAIYRMYNECPEFFDALLKTGFSAFYDDEYYKYWATEDGHVFSAIDMMTLEKGTEVFFEHNKVPDIRGWNLPEFEENLVKSNCVFQFSTSGATVNLLKEGAAMTCAKMLSTGNLKAELVEQFKVNNE